MPENLTKTTAAAITTAKTELEEAAREAAFAQARAEAAQRRLEALQGAQAQAVAQNDERERAWLENERRAYTAAWEKADQVRDAAIKAARDEAAALVQSKTEAALAAHKAVFEVPRWLEFQRRKAAFEAREGLREQTKGARRENRP